MELSEAELDKLYIIKQVKSRKLTQAEASRQLNLSTRQVRRLLVRFKSEGLSGIKSRCRGGNRLFSPEFKDTGV
ncbi:MAG: helix-turn-helix domain-containing protein [Flavobacteriales bacterium]|nr:helix-turn-helix domain-containing protein [Flavobacteriales bacterium]